MTTIKPAFPQLLTVRAVAEILQTSEKTVRRRIDCGELPIIRHGRSIRVHPDDLASYIAARRGFGNAAP